MGRPSLRTIRQEELLDAVVGIITTKGVAGLTVADVAKLAGTQPSKVHHYLGSREEMIAAAIDRATNSVEEIVVNALSSLEPHHRLDAQIEILFGADLLEPHINQLIDQLIAATYIDEAIRVNVGRMYQRFFEILIDSFELAVQNLPVEDRHQAAHTILALAHATPTFEWLSLDSKNIHDGRLAAEKIVADARTRSRKIFK
jgi:TetR/AcrR family transcriptional repressor of bet genes